MFQGVMWHGYAGNIPVGTCPLGLLEQEAAMACINTSSLQREGGEVWTRRRGGAAKEGEGQRGCCKLPSQRSPFSACPSSLMVQGRSNTGSAHPTGRSAPRTWRRNHAPMMRMVGDSFARVFADFFPALACMTRFPVHISFALQALAGCGSPTDRGYPPHHPSSP